MPKLRLIASFEKLFDFEEGINYTMVVAKKCAKCNRNLPVAGFNWKVKNVRRASYCKVCSREYIKDHYNKNRKYYIKKARKRNLEVRQKAYKYLGPYLISHPCVDCGEADILVLEFDHKDRASKKEDVSRIIQKGGPLRQLIKEVSKCEVRCANCHRRKTEKERNSWRLLYAPVA